ncbi:class I SAM-dependent methyltransferase [Paraliomyxa miuraensis]|uniref:class I SAM-dependent methyltransferase n=1 Tax=Paraliomyxa miuraensis TaxID=376150 RepID=UPI00224EF4E7|nr:class I SAM-dependent methyltransferase [Paraliomyxa miuraensis]MCX4247189.1 class I SAM-dependent methyltransferase [Paraliomyxa miuraensis]
MPRSLYDRPLIYRMMHHERSADLPFYLRSTEGRARVLEYGVGMGRVALPMVRRGQQVTGVDLSASMIEHARAALREEPEDVQARLRLVHADGRTLSLHARFDAVTCPFNGIAHHHDLRQLEAFLARVREHMRPEGLFVLDVLVPDPALLSGTTTEVPWFRDPADGTVCRATEHIEYEPLSQVLTVTMTIRRMEGEDEREPEALVLQLRQLFPQEARLLLLHHGFEVVRQQTELGDVVGYVCRLA